MQKGHKLSIIHVSHMARRRKGHRPYEPHPDRPWMPDVPGHRKKAGRGGARVIVNDETKRELERQLANLREEISPEGERKR